MFTSFPFRIYLIALVLRLIPVLLTRGLGIGLDDMFQYDMLARSLAAGHGYRWYAEADIERFNAQLEAATSLRLDFDLTSVKDYDPVLGTPTSFRAPLYPAFLAVIYFFSGTEFSRFFVARLIQATLLGAPLAPLTYFVAKRLFPPSTFHTKEDRTEKASRLSAWIIAVYPLLLVYPLGLGTENPFFVLLLASFLCILSSIEKTSSSATRFLFSGLLLGLTALTRSVILPFAVAVLCLLFYYHRRRAIPAMVGFLLVVAPWIVRNSLLHHQPTGIETSMGYNLYLGYHPQGNGSFFFGPSLDLMLVLDDAERDRFGTEKAIQFIKAQPERVLPLAANRLGYFFGLEKRVLMYFYSNNLFGFIPLPLLLTLSAVLLLPFGFVAIFAALGLSLLRWKPEHLLLLLLFVGYITPHVLILAEDRFHLALIPYFAILAARVWIGGWRDISARWKESRSGRVMVLACGLAALFLVANWGFELLRDADTIVLLLGPFGNQTYLPY